MAEATVGYYEDGYYEDTPGPYYEQVTVARNFIVGAPRRATLPKAYLVHAIGGPTTSPKAFYWSFQHPRPVMTNGPSGFYNPIIENLGTLQQSIGETSGLIGGRLASQVGELVLDLQGGMHDEITTYDWHDRQIDIYEGDSTGANAHNFNTFTRVLSARTRDASCTRSRMVLQLGDPGIELTERPEIGFYQGTGGYEGDISLKDKPKPICSGFNIFVSPILIDPINQVYQFHGGPVNLLFPLFDRAVNISYAGDISTLALADVFAWNQIPGSYISDRSRGIIRLGAPPFGRLTGSVQRFPNNNTQSAANVMQELLQITKPGIMLDNGSFGTLSFAAPGTTGIYIPPDDNRPLSAWLDILAQTAHAWWGFTSNGVFRVERLPLLSQPPAVTIQESDIDGDTLVREPALPPVWRFDAGYDPIATLHTEQEIENANVFPESLRIKVQQEYRRIKSQDLPTLIDFPSAREITINTRFQSESDASALIGRLEVLHRPVRFNFRCRVKKRLHDFRPAQIVQLNANRWNLPKPLMVRSVVKNWAANTVDLQLWG